MSTLAAPMAANCPALIVTDFIARYVNPVAVVVDASSTEDRPFLDGLRDEISGMAKTTLIELPARAHDRLSWIAHLDATALAGELILATGN